MVAGELAGGYLGSKIGGKIGRQFDKIGAKKPMKEENLAEAPPKVPLKDTGNPIQNMWNRFVPPIESSNCLLYTSPSPRDS